MIPYLLIFLGLALVLVPLFRSLGLGSILGFLSAGLILGPYGLQVVYSADSLFSISEMGVVILLFVIGLELQPRRLWTLRRQVFGLGFLQLLGCGLVLSFVLQRYFQTWSLSLLMGFGLAMSSTAFVLQALSEKNELASKGGQQSFSILLFQDLSVAPLLTAIAMLGLKTQASSDQSGIAKVGIALGALAFIVFGSRFLFRPIFKWLVTRGGREILTAAALFLVVGTAGLMEHVGLSAALGSFLAGVLLADSEYRHELEADLEPFKTLFMGLFFITVGISVNLGLYFERPLEILSLTALVMAIKYAVVFAASKCIPESRSQSSFLALHLCQGGEFGFVLFAQSEKFGLINEDQGALLSAVVTLSLFLFPFLLLASQRLSRWHKSRQKTDIPEFDKIPEAHSVVIAGFGRVGQVVGRILNLRHVPFTALEVNPQQVDFLRKFGNLVHYGDATRLDLLRAAGVEKAKVFVVGLNNIETSLKVVTLVKHHFPQVKVMARARNRYHCYKLLDLNVDYLVRDTLFSSLELSQEVLRGLEIPVQEVHRTIKFFKDYDQGLLMKQHAVYADESQLIQTTKQAQQELEGLFEKDLQDFQNQLAKT